MVFVSVTRLKLRSPRYLIPFLWEAQKSTRQAKRAAGNLKTLTRAMAGLEFWTMTLWQDEAAMQVYRNSGAHLQVMPKLRRWCDEAETAHWLQADPNLPSWSEATSRLAADPVWQLHQVRHH